MVTSMSTCIQPSATGTVLHRQKDGSRIPVACPQSILQYNAFIGGVDLCDQLRGYYSCCTKSRKLYKYIFYFLYDVVITNAFIFYKHYSPHPALSNIKEFRLRLAVELIGDYCSRRRPGRVSSSIVPLPLQHFPVKGDSDSQSLKKKRGRCAHCSKSHQRTDTTWFCQDCNVWLCHSGVPSSDCFLLWHK